MKEFTISGTGVKIDMARIKLPANATALVYNDGALVCHTSVQGESKDGAEASEIRIVCNATQVKGTSSAL